MRNPPIAGLRLLGEVGLQLWDAKILESDLVTIINTEIDTLKRCLYRHIHTHPSKGTRKGGSVRTTRNTSAGDHSVFEVKVQIH
jgi:hypothetical protein